MYDNRPIGVFDSGLGGLTVVKQLKQLLPNESIVYFGDTGRVPYGTRSKQTIIRYAKEDEVFLLSKNVKMIVAACGTVSSVAAHTGNELPVPFVEVVTPAAKVAAKATKTGQIGVLGTPATVQSGAHAKQILNWLPNAKVTAVACPLFVPLVEEGWVTANDPGVTQTVEHYLRQFNNQNIDTVIMGCTHYPALQAVLQQSLGNQVTLINMGTAAARQVKELLTKTNQLANNSPTYRYYVSDRAASFSKIAQTLLGECIDGMVEQISLGENQ